MATEIERKFLVRNTAFLAGRRGDRIVQGYVAKEPGAMTVRVRIRDGAATVGLKGPCVGLARDEFEYPIPVEDALHILSVHCGARLVRKTRYRVDFAGHVFEVDVFEGRHAGLVVAEVELEDEAESVALPPWLGPEVTGDRRYGNFSLAQAGTALLPQEALSARTVLLRPGATLPAPL